MRPSAAFWNGIADKYAQSPIKDMDAYTYTLERTRSYLSARDHVLELGSGTGSTALLLAPSVEKYVCSDISDRMMAIAKEKADAEGIRNLDIITADALDQGFKSGSYDAVLGFNLLHLLDDIPAAVRRAHSLLKPGGHFITKTACKPEGSAWKFAVIRLMIPVMQLFGKAPFVQFLPAAKLEKIMTDAGFRIIETGNHPNGMPPARYIVAQKM